jgi:hypothetical protein
MKRLLRTAALDLAVLAAKLVCSSLSRRGN